MSSPLSAPLPTTGFIQPSNHPPRHPAIPPSHHLGSPSHYRAPWLAWLWPLQLHPRGRRPYLALQLLSTQSESRRLAEACQLGCTSPEAKVSPAADQPAALAYPAHPAYSTHPAIQRVHPDSDSTLDPSSAAACRRLTPRMITLCCLWLG
ncbi:hypothetical protein VDGL01_05002 [Verticillium dahliae]